MLSRVVWALVIVVAASCDPPSPPAVTTSASAPVSASVAASAAGVPRPPPAHPAMGPAPKTRAPAKPVGDFTLAQHIVGAKRLHIWEIQPQGDAGPRLGATLVTDRKLIERIQDAIDFSQKPTPPEGGCKRCASPARFVFQTPLGLDLGGIDLGCEGDPSGTGRYWQPASTTCGLVKLAKRAQLDALIAEAKAKRRDAPTMQPGLP